MPYVTLRDISLTLAHKPLFKNVNLEIEKGQRLCLIGRNGEGKSTLLKLMNHQIEPDQGEVIYQKNLTICDLPQEVPLDIKGTVYEVVLSGLGELGNLLREYEIVTESQNPDINKLHELQHKIEFA